MTVITWKKSEGELVAFGKRIPCACPVRNEVNGLRGRCEVVYTMPAHRPYYPRQFPDGKWIISQVIPRTDRLTSPFLIKTDAWQMVEVWTVKDGCYVAKTEDMDRDTDYDLHMLNASETWGCVGIKVYQHFLWLVQRIRDNITSRDVLQFEVTS